MNTTIKTYADALSAGYTLGDVKHQLGYVSRKINPEHQPVYTAGGSRRGELYVLIPNYESSRYCLRQYLTPPCN